MNTAESSIRDKTFEQVQSVLGKVVEKGLALDIQAALTKVEEWIGSDSPYLNDEEYEDQREKFHSDFYLWKIGVNLLSVARGMYPDRSAFFPENADEVESYEIDDFTVFLMFKSVIHIDENRFE